MTKEEFLPIVQKAIDNGFRKCYIKKQNASLLFKDKIYFNISGIYEYKNYQFNKICDLTEENLEKYLK